MNHRSFPSSTSAHAPALREGMYFSAKTSRLSFILRWEHPSVAGISGQLRVAKRAGWHTLCVVLYALMDPPGACITLVLPYTIREAGVMSFLLPNLVALLTLSLACIPAHALRCLLRKM